MSAVQNYNRYGDNLARKRRRRFFLKITLITTAIITIGASFIYLMFFSPILQITEQNIAGIRTLKNEDINLILESTLNERVPGPITIKPQRNILFFNTDRVSADILANFSVIKDVKIKKDYPHKLEVVIEERTPIGTWCFNVDCSYFDENGILWGKALRSSGSLLLTIEDARIFDKMPDKIESEFMEAVREVLVDFKELDLKLSKIEIPFEPTGDLRIHTLKGYYVLIDVFSDVKEQTESLAIFLKEKSVDFKPEYIDARIAGRIYFK